MIPTPGQTIGPFFRYALPYPGGADLVPPGHLDAVRLTGQVLDGDGNPVPDALIEIRQPAPSGVVPTEPGSLHRDGWTFTGWGRAETDANGRYTFTTLTPGPGQPGAAPFFAVCVFARGLLDRLFTRAYLPHPPAGDALLSSVPPGRRNTLLCRRDDLGFVFDIRLQGEQETVFVTHE